MHKFGISIGVITTFIALTGYVFLDTHCDSCNNFFKVHASGLKADIIGGNQLIETKTISAPVQEEQKTPEEREALKKAEAYKESYLQSQKQEEQELKKQELYWVERYEEGKVIVAEYEAERQEKLMVE